MIPAFRQDSAGRDKTHGGNMRRKAVRGGAKRGWKERREKTPRVKESVGPCGAALRAIPQRGRVYNQLEVWFKHSTADTAALCERCFAFCLFLCNDPPVQIRSDVGVMTSCYVQFLSYSTQRSGMETGVSRCFPLRMKGNACEIPRVVVCLITIMPAHAWLHVCMPR